MGGKSSSLSKPLGPVGNLEDKSATATLDSKAKESTTEKDYQNKARDLLAIRRIQSDTLDFALNAHCEYLTQKVQPVISSCMQRLIRDGNFLGAFMFAGMLFQARHLHIVYTFCPSAKHSLVRRISHLRMVCIQNVQNITKINWH